MKIINKWAYDYHIHSSSFSDWIPTINEIIQFAWVIWMKEIAITDHSQAAINSLNKEFNMNLGSTARYSLKRFENVYNNVNIIFWIEWDLLNENWDVCFQIQWEESDFLILSAHSDIYKWNPETITKATIRAIERYHHKIKFIWHPCNNADFWKYYDIKKLVEIANKYKIPLEFNGKNLQRWKTNLEKLDYLLKNANEIYINSDAHTLVEFRDARKFAFDFLEKNKYIYE